MDANYSDVAVVMVPYPEYGHLNPLLRLSRLVSTYDIPVYFATIGARNHELKLRLRDWKLDEFPNLKFHDLPSPSVRFSDDELDSAALYQSSQLLSESLYAFCREISSTCRRLVIVHDTLMVECVQSLHELTTKVETYIFHGFPALSLYSWIQEIKGNNNDDEDDFFIPVKPYIPAITSSFPVGMPGFVKMLCDLTVKSAGQIMNTSRDMEARYLDALAKLSEKPVWGLGPLNPAHVPHNKKNVSHKCIEWLDKQPKHSVIFISYGTSTTFSPEQINELAIGLERSGQKFIWVLRSKDVRGKAYTPENSPKIKLPTGFEERVAERGIVARDWVPQLEILSHPSTGAYFFHAGGGSSMEGFTAGVPMATWPMHSDHPFNEVLVTRILKVGIVVKDWARKDELITSSTIEKALKTLMNSPEGEEMRQRAIDLGKAIKMSLIDGGTTHKQLESFIAHITR